MTASEPLDVTLLGDTPDFGWLGYELNFLAQDYYHAAHSAHSPKTADNAGSTPGSSTADTAEPLARSPGDSDIDLLDGLPYRRDSGVNVEEKLQIDNGFVKPPLPDRIRLKQQSKETTPTTPTTFGDDFSFMQTSLSGSGFPLDSPIGILETSYGLVLGPFYQQLLRLYFQHVHPYYPVIDEFDFDACFSESIEDESLRNARACTLGVMFLCASMYLNSRQLFGFSRWTQHSLQQMTFRAVKELYEKHSDSDQYTLTQACMLLSYWSPCYAEPRHNCGDWIKKAFAHARAAGLDKATSGSITDRSRLIWVSCIIRDRSLAFLARRSIDPVSRKENWIKVEREDFGLEICMPRYSNITSRTETVDAFLILCRLSELFLDILEMQEKLIPKLRDPEFELNRRDILRISQFDIRIREWRRAFQHYSGPHGSTIMDSKGAYYLWSIVAESATVALYLPFIQLQCKTDPLATTFPTTAMAKLKEASSKAATIVREFLVDAKPEEMPPFMSTWLILPILVLLVSLKFHGDNEDIQRLRYLLSALRVFQTRYRSAKFIKEVVENVSREMGLGVWDNDGAKMRAAGGEAVSLQAEAAFLIKAGTLMNEGIRSDTTGAAQR